MNKNNLWRVIWIVGIYAILGLILYLIIDYKVKWEYLDLNEYLYFYKCSNNLCTTTNKIDEYYSKVPCKDDICPYIKEINDSNYIILSNGETSWIYNYLTDKVLNDSFKDYHYLGNNNYVVTDKEGKQGIMNTEGKILVDFTYEDILDFKNNLISYKESDKCGIKSIDNNINIKPEYEDVILINDKYFAYKENNKYNIVAYESMETIRKYNYLSAIKGIIIVAENNKIDILNDQLNSKLVMKIDSLYEYTKEQERDSLNIISDENFVYFNVVFEEGSYKKYKYDISSDRLINWL